MLSRVWDLVRLLGALGERDYMCLGLPWVSNRGLSDLWRRRCCRRVGGALRGGLGGVSRPFL